MFLKFCSSLLGSNLFGRKNIFMLVLTFGLFLPAGVWARADLDSTDSRFPERQYRRFILPNGMKVMLISDPTMQRGAAALSVGVGSLSDPPNRQGLAHFLEHMLFLGTQKYPEAGSYQKFVSTNDGYSNAFTAEEVTIYQFEIAPEQLKDALDRFNQFFVKPDYHANTVLLADKPR